MKTTTQTRLSAIQHFRRLMAAAQRHGGLLAGSGGFVPEVCGLIYHKTGAGYGWQAIFRLLGKATPAGSLKGRWSAMTIARAAWRAAAREAQHALDN